ncbi:hypothetical protein BCR42DRAFT_417773 [Absidia repens]|uniref:Uncharacterized protein n=1 Tax=Absidia repens TaxID=90262 RepID=A0A1X2ICI5_9FUNG|nr:hypothetical protein BCR42DRAFT_417773 [Absidia repens]
MVQKLVQFQTSPQIIFYHQASDCDETKKEAPIISTSTTSVHQSFPPPTTPIMNRKSTAYTSTKRPIIPPLDFSSLCHTALFKSDVSDINADRPLSPPILSIDTLHHTPLYYTAQSTCYF